MGTQLPFNVERAVASGSHATEPAAQDPGTCLYCTNTAWLCARAHCMYSMCSGTHSVGTGHCRLVVMHFDFVFAGRQHNMMLWLLSSYLYVTLQSFGESTNIFTPVNREITRKAEAHLDNVNQRYFKATWRIYPDFHLFQKRKWSHFIAAVFQPILFHTSPPTVATVTFLFTRSHCSFLAHLLLNSAVLIHQLPCFEMQHSSDGV